MSSESSGRGGVPVTEIDNAHVLLSMGAEDTWGWTAPSGPMRAEARVQWMIHSAGLKEGMRVLECGCGTGVITQKLIKSGAQIDAVDVAEPMLQEARKNCQVSNVRFLNVNLEDPKELEDNVYDAICGVSVLHHLNLNKALVGLRAKLKPGGRFCFSEPNLLNPINKYLVFVPDQEKRKKMGVSPHEMAFVPQELRLAFEECGFHVEKLAHKDFMAPFFPSWILPFIQAVQFVAEKTPLIQRISGSLWIEGTHPR